ncbi:hypothetical protein O999_06910 [Pseudomonas putida LF54]|jgi:hypothetical protein|nr:hypothetical protein O999_06910 [Pseudomonas putida LF54]
MLARLAGNAAQLKMMGAIAMEKTATKSNMADGQGLERGFGEVFRRFIALPCLFAGEPAKRPAQEIETPRRAGAFWGSHGFP